MTDWAGGETRRTDGRVESCSRPAPACLASPRFFRPPHSCSCHLDFSLSASLSCCWLPLSDVRNGLAFELDRIRQRPMRDDLTPAEDRQVHVFLCRANPHGTTLLTKPAVLSCCIAYVWIASRPPSNQAGHDNRDVVGQKKESNRPIQTNRTYFKCLVGSLWHHRHFQ